MAGKVLDQKYEKITKMIFFGENPKFLEFKSFENVIVKSKKSKIKISFKNKRP